MKSRLDSLQIDMRSLEFDGIDGHDAPDFCDAFIVAASFTNGSDLTDAELDDLNEDSNFVYEALQNFLY